LDRNGFKRSESGFDTNKMYFCPFQSIFVCWAIVIKYSLHIRLRLVKQFLWLTVYEDRNENNTQREKRNKQETESKEHIVDESLRHLLDVFQTSYVPILDFVSSGMPYLREIKEILKTSYIPILHFVLTGSLLIL